MEDTTITNVTKTQLLEISKKNLNNHEKGENTPKVNHFCSKKVMYNKYYST
jgi:hypothetical protein